MESHFAEASADGGLAAVMSGQDVGAPASDEVKESATIAAPQPLTADDIEDLMEVAWQTLGNCARYLRTHCEGR